jgi:hypothetical protein
MRTNRHEIDRIRFMMLLLFLSTSDDGRRRRQGQERLSVPQLRFPRRGEVANTDRDSPEIGYPLSLQAAAVVEAGNAIENL